MSHLGHTKYLYSQPGPTSMKWATQLTARQFMGKMQAQMQMYMHTAMKRGVFWAQRQLSKGLGIETNGGGSDGQDRCGMTPGAVLYIGWVFEISLPCFLPITGESISFGKLFSYYPPQTCSVTLTQSVITSTTICLLSFGIASLATVHDSCAYPPKG